MTSRSAAPPSVEPDQVWKAPGGEYFRVVIVNDDNVVLKRCARGGIVLDESYSELLPMRWVLERYEFVGLR